MRPRVTAGGRAGTAAAIALTASLVAAPATEAQRAPGGGARVGVRPVLRADAIVATRTAVQAGAGLDAPLGTYARVSGVLGAGPAFGPAGVRFSARADVAARFLLDPFRQLRRGPYAGGGVSVRHEAGRATAGLLLLVGVEGGTRRGYAPSVELGLGQGVRFGLVLRAARPTTR